MTTHIAITESELRAVGRKRAIVALVAGIVIGVLMTVTATFYADSTAVVDPRMESSCNWPRHEGEMTVVTVLKGEVICWRWK